MADQVFGFERVDVYEIAGVKFEKVKSGTGVFESRKNYFVIFSSALTNDETGAEKQQAVFIWRGKDQKNLNLAQSM